MKRRLFSAVFAGAILISASVSAVLAGEITGNGTPLWTSTFIIVDGCGEGCDLVGHTLHGRSECAFSGQEDLQYVDDNGNPVPPTKGSPGNAQSWGQIPKDVRDFLTGLGFNPGIACNPTKSGGGDPA